MEISDELRALAAHQDGVLSRRQLEAAGMTDPHVRRLVRRRLLVSVARGVFVTHTGRLSFEQQTWVGVLRCAPAVLDGPSALRAAGMTGVPGDDVVQVAVEASRTVQRPGVRVRRVQGLDALALWNASPPRLRVEPAVLRVAAHATDDLRAVGLLTDVVGDRLTTPTRLRRSLEGHHRIPRRDVLADVIEGLADGANSVLEQAYLRRVQQPHGLPRGTRQAQLRGEGWRRDVLHDDEKVVVELDGRAYHSRSRSRFLDLGRDLSAVVAGYLPLRLGWEQVVGVPCETARQVGDALRQRGWPGHVRPCGFDCGLLVTG